MSSKVTDLTALAAGSVDADNDVLYIVDVSASTAGSKKITVTDLLTGRTVTAGTTTYADDVLLKLGTDGDQATLNRSSVLNAATTLSGVLIGTPATAAIPANSLILANKTADGDQVFVTVMAAGSDSIEWLRNDASAGLTVFNEAAADVDFRVEGDTNANMHVIDAGTDSQSLGSAVVAGAALSVSNLTGRATVTSVGTQFHCPSGTFNDTASANTIAIQAENYFGQTTHTATNARTYTDCATIYVAGAPVASTNVTQTASWAVFVDAGAVRLDGTLYVGDTSNATVTLGLTINQGGADDSIFELKSSDVSHTGTGFTEADTYGLFAKWVANNGGLAITGVDDTADQGLVLRGAGTTATATRSTAGTAPVIISGHLITANALATCGADKNLMVVRDNATTRFVLDSDGDSFQDVGTAWTNFDSHDDLTLLNSLAHQVSRPDNPVATQFGSWLGANRTQLESLKLVNFNDGPGEDGRAFVNMSKLTMLLVGAVRQMGEKLSVMETRLAPAGGPGKLE